MTELNKQLLHDKLTDAFINYQYRLECPFPMFNENEAVKVMQYRTDNIFHRKVDNMVAGVMLIVDEVIEHD